MDETAMGVQAAKSLESSRYSHFRDLSIATGRSSAPLASMKFGSVNRAHDRHAVRFAFVSLDQISSYHNLTRDRDEGMTGMETLGQCKYTVLGLKRTFFQPWYLFPPLTAILAFQAARSSVRV